jgi:ribosomal protein L40E
MAHSSCPGCGARLAPGTEQCDLCGTLVTEPSVDSSSARQQPAVDEAPVQSTAPAGGSPAGERLFCTACGAENPAFARFCWRCGETLAEFGGSPEPVEPSSPIRRSSLPPSAAAGAPAGHRVDPAGKHGLILVGGAALLVIVLFAVTQISGQASLPAATEQREAEAAATAVPPGVPPEALDRISSLEDRLVQTSDPAERLEIREQLVEVLMRAGAFARAGEVQEAVAREVDTADAWADAGSFYLAHMLRAEGPERSIFAERSAVAYEQALERRPGDVDVKTDLATAYLNHPSDPMRAVALVQEVLEEQPDHARARFNYGLMLTQIGRNDQARDQFEQVVRTTDPSDFVHERAVEELERLPPAG